MQGARIKGIYTDIKINENFTHEAIVSEVESWSLKYKQLPPTFWQDKEYTYCQLDSKDTRDILTQYIDSKNDSKLKSALIQQNKDGLYFQHKAVRIEIPNVRANIRFGRIKELLEIATDETSAIEDLKEGKPHALTKSRSIIFKAKSDSVKRLFIDLGGVLPYLNQTTNTRMKLSMRINSEPWQCRDCFKFGKHDCKGKVCANCGQTGHESKGCKTELKTCSNCKRKGHRAKDVHCGAYLNEVIKVLRKMDLPIEFYENEEYRFQVAKQLQPKIDIWI